MRLGIALIIAVCALAPGPGRTEGPAKKEEAARKDLAALQGRWALVGNEYMGKKASKEDIENLKRETLIKGDKVTVWTEDTGKKEIISESTLKLDPTARPRAMDLTFTGGMLKGTKTLAIYELDGDSLKVCYALDGEKRPTEFAGKRDGKAFLLIYKRVRVKK